MITFKSNEDVCTLHTSPVPAVLPRITVDVSMLVRESNEDHTLGVHIHSHWGTVAAGFLMSTLLADIVCPGSFVLTLSRSLD